MKKLTALILLLTILLTACGLGEPLPTETLTPGEQTGEHTEADPSVALTESTAPSTEMLEVHFIDVGQADCALLRTNDHAMLIDGGNVGDSSLVVSYLLNLGIEELDCVVCTHAHEDHAGALGGIMAVFPVETVYVTTTTYASNCYDDFMRYVDQQGLTPNIPSPGDSYMLGQCQITFLGPVKSYAETNDTSLICRADYGNTSFLFTGDMETSAEADLLDSGANVKADVLKVGHHGSSTSTSYRFLYEVDPQWAVISCGKDNSYGHPNDEVVSRLRDAGVTFWRTDLSGTIMVVTDGENLTFSATGDSQPDTGNAQESLTFIGNKNSHKFHTEDCKNLPKEENRVIFETYDEAIDAGYSPCGSCIG